MFPSIFPLFFISSQRQGQEARKLKKKVEKEETRREENYFLKKEVTNDNAWLEILKMKGEEKKGFIPRISKE